MTKQAELRDLLEQVVGAEGPLSNDTLDALTRALFGKAATFGDWGVLNDAINKGDMNAALAFAERALPGVKGFSDEPSVGWKFGVYRLTQPGLWTAWVRQHADDGVEVKQRTPALALVAAVLKALIEQESE